MPIAIQENMLSGGSISEKFQHARALGFDGIELEGAGLTAKVPEIVDAMVETGVMAATVNHGAQGNLLDPDPAERERALALLRQSVVNAVDIGATGVVFVPHYGAHVLPDLSPWMSSAELEAEMLHMHLRTLSDYAEALGVSLYIAPLSRSETELFNRVEQVGRVTRRLNHHRVKIAADMYHMAREGEDIAAALEAEGSWIGHLRLANCDHGLPEPGANDFATAAAALKATGYDGWAVYACAGDAAAYAERLPASLAYIREIGMT